VLLLLNFYIKLGRPFRLRVHKLSAAPSCGDDAVTSFPADGKTYIKSEMVHDIEHQYELGNYHSCSVRIKRIMR
jgi:hypothetical protein